MSGSNSHHSMSRLLDDESDELPQRERELTLSTGAILAIFLGLVLLCGVFFGFGYNLGRKSTALSNTSLPSTSNDAEPEPEPTGSSTFDNFKPSPGSPTARNSAATTPATPNSATETGRVVVKDNAPETPAARATAPPAASHSPNPPAPSTSAPARGAAPAIAPGGAFVVQIAAISATHKDDADLLANALRGRGYTVAERTDPQDKLIHVQLGPFATKIDAETMRQRLVADGYNPIIK